MDPKAKESYAWANCTATGKTLTDRGRLLHEVTYDDPAYDHEHYDDWCYLDLARADRVYKFLNENPRPELADRHSSLQTRQALTSAATPPSLTTPTAMPKEASSQQKTRSNAQAFSGHGISALLVFGGAEDVQDNCGHL